LPTPWAREGWLTPGGAIDPGETPAQAAVREVAEETGHRITLDQIGRAVATDSGRCQAADGYLFYVPVRRRTVVTTSFSGIVVRIS
jgi:8-oxo-dGTP pyrophosphatase MutT (NUDIX family)